MSQYGKETARNRLEICQRWMKCHKPGKRGWTWYHKWQYFCPESRWHKIQGCREWVSDCHRHKMSQWTKCPVDVPFGSKCKVEVPLVDVLSMHHSKTADWGLVPQDPVFIYWYTTVSCVLGKFTTPHPSFPPDLFLYVNLGAKGAQKLFKTLAP